MGGINKGQGSLEYLFMIAAVLVIVLMVFRALGGAYLYLIQ